MFSCWISKSEWNRLHKDSLFCDTWIKALAHSWFWCVVTTASPRSPIMILLYLCVFHAHLCFLCSFADSPSAYKALGQGTSFDKCTAPSTTQYPESLPRFLSITMTMTITRSSMRSIHKKNLPRKIWILLSWFVATNVLFPSLTLPVLKMCCSLYIQITLPFIHFSHSITPCLNVNAVL